MEPTKLQRWIDLVAFLAARRFPVAKQQIWSELPAYRRGLDGDEQEQAAVRRMFERDKDELRAMGVPIESVASPVRSGTDDARYRLPRDFYLPRLRVLNEEDAARSEKHHASGRRRPAPGTEEVTFEEAARALGGLRELATLPGFPLARHADSAFRKLSFDLMPGGLGDPPVRYAPSVEAGRASRTVAHLFEALSRKKRIAFRYRAMTRAEELERRVRPYGLLFELGRWYLVGWDEARRDARVFRVGRMTAVAVNRKAPATPDFQVPSDFDLADYVNRKAWELGSEAAEEEAALRFDFPWGQWAERNGHGVLLEEGDDGSQLRRFHVRSRRHLVRWALGLAGQVRIASPGCLRAQLRDAASALAELHEDAGPEGSQARSSRQTGQAQADG